jgi:tricorn protease-like protein
MHFVDKWLDGDELKQDEVNRAATMREKTLQIVEAKQSEIERLSKEVDRLSQVVLYHDGQMVDMIQEFAERACDELRTGNIIMDKSIQDIIYNLANNMKEELK